MIIASGYAPVAANMFAGATAATHIQGGTNTGAADTTNSCAKITWTAPNSDTWHVVARLDSVEAF